MRPYSHSKHRFLKPISRAELLPKHQHRCRRFQYRSHRFASLRVRVSAFTKQQLSQLTLSNAHKSRASSCDNVAKKGVAAVACSNSCNEPVFFVDRPTKGFSGALADVVRASSLAVVAGAVCTASRSMSISLVLVAPCLNGDPRAGEAVRDTVLDVDADVSAQSPSSLDGLAGRLMRRSNCASCINSCTAGCNIASMTDEARSCSTAGTSSVMATFVCENEVITLVSRILPKTFFLYLLDTRTREL
jgi:hypothetical protein